MLNFAANAKIFAYLPATDMRKGFGGLSAIIREEFPADPIDGSLFLFINKRRDRMKLLHFADGGFWLYYRLLEAGTFVETLEKRQGLKISCVEEIAWRNGFIDKAELRVLGESMRKNEYGQYLLQLASN